MNEENRLTLAQDVNFIIVGLYHIKNWKSYKLLAKRQAITWANEFIKITMFHFP